MRYKISMLLSFFMMAGLAAFAQETPGLNVAEIVRKANHVALYQGADGKGRARIVITDKQGRVRNREFSMLRKNVGQGDQDQKYFLFFSEPSDIRKMTFMVHKYADARKGDDRWLYMPSMDLVKRIAASDKRTSFVGSDFLYEDISGRNLDEDVHELISTTSAYYVIKNTPKAKANVEFEYYIAHVDRKTFMPIKIEYFKKGARLYRIIEVNQLAQIAADEGGRRVAYPTVIRSTAKNLETGSQSEMSFSDIRYNVGLSDALFSERYLRRPPRDVLQ